MKNIHLNFEISAFNCFKLARDISTDLGVVFIPSALFKVILFISPDSPIKTILDKKGVVDELLIERVKKYLAEQIVPKQVSLYRLNISENSQILIEKDILELLQKASEIAQISYGKNTIGINDLISALAEYEEEEYTKILNNLDPPSQVPSKTASETTFAKQNPITLPSNLSSFLTIINNKYQEDETECNICGREEETHQLIRVLMKTTKRNAILVGEPGVGKTALVEKLTWMIVTNNCPDFFKDSIVVSLDVNAIVAGTKYRGSAEERFMNLINYLENHPECILFIDEIHLLLGAGACKDGDLDLANALKPILARGATRVIGATTNDEYQKYFSKDGALKRRFEKILVNEPRSDEIYPMIKNQIKKLEQEHQTLISEDLVNYVILNASCYNFETKNPDRTLDLIDKCMVCAQIDNRHEVTKQDVLKNFSINKRKFDNLTYKVKMSTAYHEAGHYIVYRFSPELSQYNILAISIMPTESYLGVNVFEIDPDITPSESKKYFIQRLGSLLAGRIAEKMYSNEITAGASGDLTKATQIAKNYITEYGLDETISQDRVYFKDMNNSLYNDELISAINVHIDSLLKQAREYVENLLFEKQDYLVLLVDALMEHGILSAKQINELFEEYEQKKKNNDLDSL